MLLYVGSFIIVVRLQKLQSVCHLCLFKLLNNYFDILVGIISYSCYHYSFRLLKVHVGELNYYLLVRGFQHFSLNCFSKKII